MRFTIVKIVIVPIFLVYVALYLVARTIKVAFSPLGEFNPLSALIIGWFVGPLSGIMHSIFLLGIYFSVGNPNELDVLFSDFFYLVDFGCESYHIHHRTEQKEREQSERIQRVNVTKPNVLENHSEFENLNSLQSQFFCISDMELSSNGDNNITVKYANDYDRINYTVIQFTDLNIILYFANCVYRTERRKGKIKVFLDSNNDKAFLLVFKNSRVKFSQDKTSQKNLITLYSLSKAKLDLRRVLGINYSVHTYEDSKCTKKSRQSGLKRLLIYLIPIYGWFEYNDDGKHIYSWSHSTQRRYDDTFAIALVTLPFYPIFYFTMLISLVLYPFVPKIEHLSGNGRNKSQDLNVYKVDRNNNYKTLFQTLKYSMRHPYLSVGLDRNGKRRYCCYFDDQLISQVSCFPLILPPSGMRLYLTKERSDRSQMK
ncbi:hypothetical protein RI065_06470 [Mycoplasmatota bacterium zrk1]